MSYMKTVANIREEILEYIDVAGEYNVGKTYGMSVDDVNEMSDEEFVERCVSIELENMSK